MPIPKKHKTFSISAAIYGVLFAGAHYVNAPSTTGDCGGSNKSRWEKKILTDEDVHDINFTPRVTTIAVLNGEEVPLLKMSHDTERMKKEFQVYTVKNCVITESRTEKDKDIHLVLRDPRNKKAVMVAEIPCPTCDRALESDFVDSFRAARAEYLRYRNVLKNYTFNVTGVFFVDQEHSGEGPTGEGPNNVELHPVLRIEPVAEITTTH